MKKILQRKIEKFEDFLTRVADSEEVSNEEKISILSTEKDENLRRINHHNKNIRAEQKYLEFYKEQDTILRAVLRRLIKLKKSEEKCRNTTNSFSPSSDQAK